MINFFKAAGLLGAVCLFSLPLFTKGYTVTDLNATYKNGQVFLTWKNAGATNLQYNVYRSITPFLVSAELTNGKYLGYVRDNSGKNIRKSQLKGSGYYFVIADGQPPLASDNGLYVATCSSGGLYYYAVTVTNLSNNQEDKNVVVSENSLLLPVNEQVDDPQPVLQTITNQSNDDVSYEYVIWGNNQDEPNWPAFNNAGSYGYNFTLQKRGNPTNQPLCIYFQDQDPFKKLGSEFCTDCNMLQLDDWIPNGENTYWVGYHSTYNMYTNNTSNSVVSSGVIKTYTQVRTHEIIRWAKKQPGVDGKRVYMNGNSHNGFGAMLTAMNIPSEIASLYLTSIPIIYKTKSGDKREHQFGSTAAKLPTDKNYPGTSDPILIWDYTDMRNWYRINKPDGVPYIQGINGKNDTKAGWVNKYHWYDTVNTYRQGGTWFWDQRVHSGDDGQFVDSEIKTDYTRYYTNRSYPAFSFCTINQNPGDGDPNDGDPYGAINGYLDWKDNTIVDQECSYSINCFLKKLYVGGVLDPEQYSSCFTDITLRRTKNFQPSAGQTITWTNYDNNNELIQSGSFVYDGKLLTLYGIKIKKAGCTIGLSISGCLGRELSLPAAADNCKLFKTPDGYSLMLNTTYTQTITVDVFDMLGRSVLHINQDLGEGSATIPLRLPSGIYVMKAESNEIRFSGKMIF